MEKDKSSRNLALARRILVVTVFLTSLNFDHWESLALVNSLFLTLISLSKSCDNQGLRLVLGVPEWEIDMTQRK